jgi:cytoplasmic iron level regulating protein YaaA (DUF328/UPF0246 family)
MLILLSPAKTLDFETKTDHIKCSQPDFLEFSKNLINGLKNLSSEEIERLMNISPKLANLNRERFTCWTPEHSFGKSKQAILAFKGDVYEGLKAWDFTKEDYSFAQKNLRLLSGLYGILRPLDLIQAHRLEMGTAYKNKVGKDLYSFWGSLIREKIEMDLKSSNSKTIVNLASQEYFKVTRPNELNANIVSPVFKDEKNGKFKIISFYAKKARGMMASHLIKNQIESIDGIYNFSEDGYEYDQSESSELEPVFIRSEANRIAA